MSKTAEIGAKGESLAAKYLMEKGYEILERNYRYKHAEIDIIAKKGQLVVFIEVKTRTKANFGFPEDSVDDKKAAKVIEGAEQYVLENDWRGDIRFDIVSIIMETDKSVQHFEDAFY